MIQEPGVCKSPNFKWFGLALQALVVLSKRCDDPCPSHTIAEQIKSEPTLIRRILSQLACGGILETREGRIGGYRLKKAANEITLAEVYLALEAKEPCWSAMLEATGPHEFGQEMQGSFKEIIGRVHTNILEVLKDYTIADLTA
ncbi:Rrf2 family transcriptional regulator [Paenibacillus caui]|uniref:Rrf2 family transcriptional regulator n=1 Tax=Paenibacillus caui TaxID=2873927 RepID=UPI001CA82CD9|nr:Rrf2 family transcriptional regulator [Paenibacillus caui]